MRFSLALLAAALPAAIACSTSSSSSSGPRVIRASDYNQHCAVAADCAIVSEGDLCGCVGCGGASINAAGVAKYDADSKTLKSQCTNPPLACPASCIYSEATCSAGTCGVCHTPGCTDGGAPDGGADGSHD